MKKPMSGYARLALSTMLAPLEGDSTRLLMYRSMRDTLSLNEEENKQLGVKIVPAAGGGAMTYFENADNDPMKVIEVGEIITEEVCKILKEMEETKELRQELLDLFLWFKPESLNMQAREKQAAKDAKPESGKR